MPVTQSQQKTNHVSLDSVQTRQLHVHKAKFTFFQRYLHKDKPHKLQISFCQSICLSVYLGIYLSFIPAVRQSFRPIVGLSVYLSMQLSHMLVYLYTCVSICHYLFVYPSIQLSLRKPNADILLFIDATVHGNSHLHFNMSIVSQNILIPCGIQERQSLNTTHTDTTTTKPACHSAVQPEVIPLIFACRDRDIYYGTLAAHS